MKIDNAKCLCCSSLCVERIFCKNTTSNINREKIQICETNQVVWLRWRYYFSDIIFLKEKKLGIPYEREKVSNAVTIRNVQLPSSKL